MWNKTVQGIPDELFIRGDVPMTKSEVRAITLSKLQLERDSLVLDIGCGTGSVSIECGLRASEGWITAVDQKEEAIHLTQENGKRFQVKNITTIQGKAPEILPKENFDRIFLGGGSKDLEHIIGYAKAYLNPEGIFVANTILLNSSYEILQLLKKNNFKNINCIQVQLSRGYDHKVGWMMKGLNPIYIISAEQ
ncbi:cobalt-precorrin 7 C15-methyltransferase [Natranaerovirga pectinivora]|uniref:Cobalt-precorrin 7 C15-methyltransferase n=1 Tax=Natranaerovirga pectinivora TaxID=682400 RepID=A0A4R3MK67_9FIRM|nr:precorrin-6Y C5,15-methyltransferase (decarboxylating) subunit CbiT [Natranaerovirga pectinivora]TCT13796.1 cobalt-precorrin 7 C15-methyltransferase [Natranaerovirga pectinivora]